MIKRHSLLFRLWHDVFRYVGTNSEKHIHPHARSLPRTKAVYTSEAKLGLPRFRRIIFFWESSKQLGLTGMKNIYWGILIRNSNKNGRNFDNISRKPNQIKTLSVVSAMKSFPTRVHFALFVHTIHPPLYTFRFISEAQSILCFIQIPFMASSQGSFQSVPVSSPSVTQRHCCIFFLSSFRKIHNPG
jgi:hypothetical protein